MKEAAEKKQVYNPYLPTYEYVPDGEPHVFGDRVYIYGSHDRFDGEMFCLNDYICYSADVKDLTEWKYEGVIFRKDQDPRNQNPSEDNSIPRIYDVKSRFGNGLNPPGIHALWAPDVVKGPDGRYYLYYCLDFLPEIGVAVCDTPAGSYEYLGLVRHKNGTVLGKGEDDLSQFDPGIFIDDDGEIYLYSGNAPMHKEHIGGKQGSQVMTLEPDMLTLKTEPRLLLPSIADSEGTGFEGHEFFEASSIRKIGNTYYFVYSSVLSHELCYAVSDKPDRDYKYGGTLIDIGDVGLNGRTAAEALNCLGNTHGGMECINGQWYVFYHRQSNRTQFSRQGCAEKIEIADDGSIRQVPVTSCGLNDGPLEGKGTYPACICCRLTGKDGAVFSGQKEMQLHFPYLTQDVPDKEPAAEKEMSGDTLPVQYVANIKDGTMTGYKSFAFYNLQKITLKLRGKAKGTIAVFTEDLTKPVGTLNVDIAADTWQDITGMVSVSNGPHDLYFRYEGEGALDFITFTLHADNQ